MKTIPLLISGLALAFSITAAAQSIDDKKTTFTFKQLPHVPLKGQPRFYTSSVTLTYMAKERKQDSLYQIKLAAAEAHYAQLMGNYEADKKAAEEEYQKALEDYKKKDGLTKILDKEVHNEGKPVKRNVYPPSKDLPEEPEKSRSLNEDVLAANYIKLEGFEKNEEQAIKVNAYLLGFENSAPDLVVTEHTVVEKSGTYVQKKYKYVYANKHPMGLKVFSPEGKLLWEVYPKQFLTETENKTPEYNSEYELENYWQKNKQALIEKQQDLILEKNLKFLQDTLNSRLGYADISREAILFSVTDKKDSYKDYVSALAAAEEGFHLLNMNNADTYPNAVAKLKEAAETWEKALEESDPNNKKARVDKNVTIATHFNLAETLVWVKDFDKALEHIKQVQTMDLDKKEKKLAASLEAFINDQKAREIANK